MNVDTGTFEALCERVDALAAQVTLLEALVRAGEESARRKLGFGGDRAAGASRSRHLRAMRGER